MLAGGVGAMGSIPVGGAWKVAGDLTALSDPTPALWLADIGVECAACAAELAVGAGASIGAACNSNICEP